MRSVRDIGDLVGKKVFVRVDFNVPTLGNEVADDFRIRKTLPLINFLRARGAQVILASHSDPDDSSLAPVCTYLRKNYPVSFIEEYYPDLPEGLSRDLSAGKLVLLENLRFYPEERSNDEDFARHLASLGDYYVNEAFSASHRPHASIIGVPKFLPGFAGFVFEEEMKNLSRAFHPEYPFLFALGGAKFETKMPLVRKFFSLADRVFVGGALANDFLKAQGKNVGRSILSEGKLDLKEFFTEKLILPLDVLVKNASGIELKVVDDVTSGDTIVDVGPQSINALRSTIDSSRFILWNGPLGNYEMGFRKGTLSLARAIAQSKAITIVGGGDTVASIAELKLEDKFTFVSTAGGAMLEYLANETLSGIEALK